MADDKILRDAQYRKGLGIAWFNATNSAIEMVKLEHEMRMFQDNRVYMEPKKKGGKRKITGTPPPTIEERLEFWRNVFLEKHKHFYATVIASVGVAYNQKETLDQIKATKSREELADLWRGMSEDERHDKEIKKVVAELKKKYEKA